MVPYKLPVQGLLAFVTLSLHVLQASATQLPACPDRSKAEFDFVVVGAGVGGGPVASRLAERGFSVLVVEAGHEVITVNTTIPFYFGRAVEDPVLMLNYSYNEYSPGEKFSRERHDSWYPRARGIGGSALHNALVNNIGDTAHGFNHLANMFHDQSWSPANMRNYFKLLEHNLDFNRTDPDHGYDGWLKTSLNPPSILNNPQFADTQLSDIVNALLASSPPIADLNSVADNTAIGIWGPSYTIDETRNRSSVHERLMAVKETSEGKLQFALDTIATKVALCSTGPGRAPVAYGVEIARGAGLAVASDFDGKQKLKTELVTARYEVIVSAGVFQTPQLLMLSGIGDRYELSRNGIESVVHLPGVGTNLQDHDEVANIWTLKQNYTLFNGCTVLYTPETDPCLEQWIETDHQNLYALGAALFMNMSRSAHAINEPDIMVYWLPGFFRGFFHGFAQEIAETHNAITAVVLKAHPSSRGVVRLTGSHPQDPLYIEKRHFEAPRGRADMVDIRESIKSIRSLIAHPGFAQHVEAQAFPPPEMQSDEEIEDHILENVFGHHACCTAAMGPDDDPNAVLDGNFKVRGVEGLRVVDISSWPIVPGWFVATPTYMISEKAADVITAAVRGAKDTMVVQDENQWSVMDHTEL